MRNDRNAECGVIGHGNCKYASRGDGERRPFEDDATDTRSAFPFRIPHSAVRVLGIDPGLNITGYAVLEVAADGPKVVEAGVVRGQTRDSLTARLAEIHDGVADVIATLRPSAMALEQLYSHYEHPRTSILMGHARGVICLAAAKGGVEVHNYSATQIKKVLTGNGSSAKGSDAVGCHAGAAADRSCRSPPMWPTRWRSRFATIIFLCDTIIWRFRRRDKSESRCAPQRTKSVDHEDYRQAAACC